MEMQEGKVISRRGKYFVQVGDQMHELKPDPLGTAETFKALVGQVVQVALTDPKLVAIITKKPPTACYTPCFICYVDPIEFSTVWKIDPVIRQTMLKTFLEQGFIDEKTYEQQMTIK
jgi:hypothetical protein